MTKKLRTFVAAGALAFGLIAAPAATHATVITFDLGIEFSGATAPAGTPPWLRATFDDAGGSGSVTLTMELLASFTANNPDGKVFEWYFNLDPAMDATTLGIAHVSGADAETVSTGIDAFHADGDGFYDILFEFANSGSTQLASAENLTSVYTITGTGLTADDFDFLSAPGPGNSPGPFLTAAHVGGLPGNDDAGQPCDDCASGWLTSNGTPPPPPRIDVPEPTTLLIFGAGLLGLAVIRRRRRI
jgi:hypothetical protein